MYVCFRWVPIKGNDWYWIRHHIKVGMHVIVEILVSDVTYIVQIFVHAFFKYQCIVISLIYEPLRGHNSHDTKILNLA